MTSQLADKSILTEELLKELKIFEELKPFISLCLSLNHDLNNPLAGILGYVEFLLEESDQLSEEHQEFIKQINKCAERMKMIIDNLCEAKIALARGIDLKQIVAAYSIGDNKSK